MSEKYKKISGKILTSNPYWDYRYDEYTLPNGNTGEYFFVETPGSVMVIPVMPDGKIAFVRQYRYLNQKFSIEFPGGGMKSELSQEDNAKKELREESGLISGKIIKIGEFNPFNGVTNEICNVFIAGELTKVKSSPDDSEEFDNLYLSKDEVIGLIRSNEIWDGMTLSAWTLYVNSKYWS